MKVKYGMIGDDKFIEGNIDVTDFDFIYIKPAYLYKSHTGGYYKANLDCVVFCDDGQCDELLGYFESPLGLSNLLGDIPNKTAIGNNIILADILDFKSVGGVTIMNNETINQLQCLLDSDYSPTVKLSEIQRLIDDQRDQWEI